MNLYVKTKAGLKEIVDIEKTARLLGIKPHTFTAYLAREQIVMRKIRIKNLVFFFKEDLEKLIQSRKGKTKEQESLDLFHKQHH